MSYAGDDELECNDALTQRVLTGMKVREDFDVFKKKYTEKFELEFFKNTKSWMKVNLENGQVSDIGDVNDHAKSHPKSRTADLLLWP
ncbi:MAG: hypothetical protein GY821_17610 [Gammaproteobacteria bacterium]|nr:hypothetical protein [Gammaproteobacteria bacterium]